MNKVILMGWLTRDPEIKYPQGTDTVAVGRYTLAVGRRIKQEEGQNADFVSCVTFGKAAEFAEKYFQKGTKIAIEGRIQTGSYTNKDGQKVYTTDVIVEHQEFAESKNDGSRSERDSAVLANSGYKPETSADQDGFMNIPDGVDEELPFN